MMIRRYHNDDKGLMVMANDDDFLTRKQAAAYLTKIGCPISYATLANRAAHNNAGKGPPFTRTGWRTVRYRKQDLDAWAYRNTERVE